MKVTQKKISDNSYFMNREDLIKIEFMFFRWRKFFKVKFLVLFGLYLQCLQMRKPPQFPSLVANLTQLRMTSVKRKKLQKTETRPVFGKDGIKT